MLEKQMFSRNLKYGRKPKLVAEMCFVTYQFVRKGDLMGYHLVKKQKLDKKQRTQVLTQYFFFFFQLSIIFFNLLLSINLALFFFQLSIVFLTQSSVLFFPTQYYFLSLVLFFNLVLLLSLVYIKKHFGVPYFGQVVGILLT